MKQVRIVGLGDYQNYYSYFTYSILEGAIRCGAWFRPIALFGQDLYQVAHQIDFFKPHIIVAHMIFNRRPHKRDDVFDMLRKARKKLGVTVFYHMGDARAEPRYPHDISDIVDAVLINNGEGQKWTDSWWQVPCYHWPYMALYQKDIATCEDEFNHPLVFTGRLTEGKGHYHSKRTEFVEELKKIVTVKTYPDEKWGNSRFLTAEISASAGAVLGMQMSPEVYLYNDVRPFQYIGAGALYFHDKHPNMDAFFEDEEHYVSFTDLTDFIEKYKYYAFTDAGFRIKQQAFRYGQRWHSTKARMEVILDIWRGKDVKPLVLLDDIRKGEMEIKLGLVERSLR